MRFSRPGRALATLVKRSKVALAVAIFLVAGTPRAQNLGVIGPVYEIAEPNLIEVILARLREAEAGGQLARLQRDAQARVRSAVESPTPVAGITRTTRSRSFYYDPSIVVPHAITDVDGRVIVAPGTRINPLDTVSLSRSLLFIDARDAPQLARAKQLIDERGGRIKVILTAGSYLESMRRWQRPVFFDQEGQLTTKLGIRHVPALVSQEGKRLRVDEIL